MPWIATLYKQHEDLHNNELIHERYSGSVTVQNCCKEKEYSVKVNSEEVHAFGESEFRESAYIRREFGGSTCTRRKGNRRKRIYSSKVFLANYPVTLNPFCIQNVHTLCIPSTAIVQFVKICRFICKYKFRYKAIGAQVRIVTAAPKYCEPMFREYLTNFTHQSILRQSTWIEVSLKRLHNRGHSTKHNGRGYS